MHAAQNLQQKAHANVTPSDHWTEGVECELRTGTTQRAATRGDATVPMLPHWVQWSEDVIKADPFLGRSRVRFRVPPWVSNTIARDHLA